MGYSAKRPHGLFKNEAERAAWTTAQSGSWEEAGRAARAKGEALLTKLGLTEAEPTPLSGEPLTDWEKAGREVRTKTERLFARLASVGN
jgi:hypothetical protein